MVYIVQRVSDGTPVAAFSTFDAASQYVYNRHFFYVEGPYFIAGPIPLNGRGYQYYDSNPDSNMYDPSYRYDPSYMKYKKYL